MSYHGIQDGMPIYDFLDEVPKSTVESGKKFILLYPPEEMIQKGSEAYQYRSPPLIALIGYAILIAIIGIVSVTILQQLGYILQGRPGQKVDDNLFEGGDGSVWVRDPDTGEWKMQKGPTSSMILWAVVAIALIVVVVLIYIGYTKKKGGEKE